MNQLDQLLTRLLPNVERLFYDAAPEEVAPLLHLVLSEQEDVVVSLAADDDSDQRRRRLYFAGRQFGGQPIETAVLITEAWLVTKKPGDPLPDRRPSEHPQREEVLVITAMSRLGQQAALTLPILRNKHGGRTLGQPQGEMQARSLLLEAFWRGVRDRHVTV